MFPNETPMDRRLTEGPAFFFRRPLPPVVRHLTPLSTPYFLSVLALASTMGTSRVVGATLPSFQSAKDKVILALALAASTGTRTG